MPEKFYVTSENKVVIKCPHCGKTKNLDSSQFTSQKREIKGKVKCPCGESFEFIVERRRNFRKQTNLPGKFKVIAPTSKRVFGNMVVKDISKTGVKILPVANCNGISEGDTLLLQFRLNDKNETDIEVEVIIVNIINGHIGAKFAVTESYDPSMKAIGFYLF